MSKTKPEGLKCGKCDEPEPVGGGMEGWWAFIGRKEDKSDTFVLCAKCVDGRAAPNEATVSTNVH